MNQRLSIALELVSLATGLICLYAVADEVSRGKLADAAGAWWRRHSAPYAAQLRILREWDRGRRWVIWEAGEIVGWSVEAKNVDE